MINDIDDDLELTSDHHFTKLIGYINPLGIFVLNIRSKGINLCSIDRTSKAGYFEKRKMVDNHQKWLHTMNVVFDILYSTVRTQIKHPFR